jgi:hypothetical protein
MTIIITVIATLVFILLIAIIVAYHKDIKYPFPPKFIKAFYYDYGWIFATPLRTTFYEGKAKKLIKFTNWNQGLGLFKDANHPYKIHDIILVPGKMGRYYVLEFIYISENDPLYLPTFETAYLGWIKR